MEQSLFRFTQLLKAFSEGTCSEEEKTALMALIRDPANTELLQAYIEESIKNGTNSYDIDAIRAEEIFQKVLHSQTEATTPVRSISYMKWAAAILIILSTAIYYLLLNKKTEDSPSLAQSKSQDVILPASNKAMLTLADGSVIPLDNISEKTLLSQGETNIIRLNDGSILYKAGVAEDTVISYNTISTPKGGQYQIILPDSTHVWLNAASSIRFPTSFKNDTRTVELSGEAYFEVTENKTKPFLVKVQESTITVLGTSFNINAYADEHDINTTLLEGSVKFDRNNIAKKINPGEQIIYNTLSNSMNIRDADIRQVMSWKNGFFEFDNMELSVIMRQIARWYDVELEFHRALPDLKLSGGISRKLTLQDLQKLMEANGVLFSIEGKKIIVDH